MTDLYKTNEELLKEQSVLTQSINNLQLEKEEVISSLETTKKEVDEQIAVENDKLKAKDSELTALITQKEDLIIDLDSVIEDKQDDLNIVNEEIIKAEDTKNEKLAEYNKLIEDIETKKSQETKTGEQTLKDIEDKISSAILILENLNIEIETTNKQYYSYVNDKDKAESEIKELETKKEEYNDSVKALINEVKTLERRRNSTPSEEEQAKAEMVKDQLNKEISELAQAKGVAESELQILEDGKKALIKEKFDFQNAVNNLTMREEIIKAKYAQAGVEY